MSDTNEEKMDSTEDVYTDRNGVTYAASEWMKAIDGNKEISMINIPGSHDSGTFDLPVSWPVKGFAETQDRDFEDQLGYGIRFFDIRVRATTNSQLVLHHGSVYTGITLWQFLNSAKNYLKAHPSEALIMSIKQDYTSMPGVTDHPATIFRNHYYSDPVFYKGDSVLPKLNDVRGKIVILNRMAGDFAGIPQFSWKDNGWTSATIEEGNPGINVHIQDKYKGGDADDKVEWVGDFLDHIKAYPYTRSYYISFTSLSGANTPYRYAVNINANVARDIKNRCLWAALAGKKCRIGWVVMDYAGNEWDPKLYREVINSNEEWQPFAHVENEI